MSAIVKACMVANTIQNTGVDCEVSMGPSAGFLIVPKTFTFDDTDLLDPVAFFNAAVHASAANRIYPIFGNAAPIRTITNNKESDVIATLDDGSQVFVRYGFFNRTFNTTDGGLCYAKALQSLNKSGYSIIEIDNAGNVMCRLNTDGTYSGLKCSFMYSPSPDLPDFKNPAKTNFMLSYSPIEYVKNGVILSDPELQLIDLVGLIDSTITSAAAATTTLLKIAVTADCSGTDLVDLLGADLADSTNFVVTRVSTGVVQTITSASIVSGHIELVGTFTSGVAYKVAGAAPSVLLTNGIDGYDINTSVTITIP